MRVRGGELFPRPSRATVGLVGVDEPDEPALCGGARTLYRAASASRRAVSQRPAQGRCDGGAPAQLPAKEGVVFVGKAQEKAPVFRTEKRHSPHSGRPYPWIVKSTAMVNHYYIYAVDRDFGPFFLKFCTYFPYNAKLCLNGHEYAKRQLERQGIAFRRSTMAFSAAPIPSGCSRSATACRPRRSTACCASGCTCCRIRSPPRITRPAIATIFRSCRPSSH